MTWPIPYSISRPFDLANLLSNAFLTNSDLDVQFDEFPHRHLAERLGQTLQWDLSQ